MMRLARGLWSLSWLTILLAGIPAALVHYVGWPLPDHWPTRPEAEQWVAQPLTRSAVIGAVAVLMWLLWALLVYALVVEILTSTRRAVRALRRLRLPPLPTPMQATASGVLGAAVFGMPTGTAAAAPADAVHPVAASVSDPAATSADPAPAARVAAPQRSTDDRDDRAAGRVVRAGTGVTLPDGGWLPDQTAAGTASAAALVWLQRRRRYLPRPPAGADRDDPDLAPLPDTVAVIEHQRQRGPAGDDEAAGSDDLDTAATVPAADPAASLPAVVGHTADGPLPPHALPAGGVGLTGDGADAAARGILTATLLSGDAWHPDRDARIVTTGADLHTVLGATADQHRATRGLTVAANLDDAINAIEQVAMARTALAAHRRSEAPAVGDGGPAGPAFPPVVLLTTCPAAPAEARRLAVVLTLAAHLDIAGVLLGPWPHGATWLVDADGVSHPAEQPGMDGPRLCVLSPVATADLLTVLREARSDRHPVDPRPTPTQVPRQAPGHAELLPAAPAAGEPTGPTGATPAAGGRPAGNPPLQARLLGRPVLRRADGTAIPIRRTAALQVLVFLAVHRAGATSSQLIAALWPGPRPHAAAGRLYTPVSELRITLQEAAGADVLVRVGDRYHLDDRHIDIDLWRLEAAVDAAAVDPDGRPQHLRRIVDRYTGELAADRQWPWLAAPREAIRRRVIDAYAALAADESDPSAALALLQDALRVDPVNEALCRLAHRASAKSADGTPSRAGRDRRPGGDIALG
jgi:DNA-binding SARP family transcriptional activator